jgi:hypothetical protein
MHVEPEAEVTPAQRPIFGLPVDARILFANHKGVYKRSIERRKTKLLQKLGFLVHFLDPDEKIVFVAVGCSPYTLLERLTIRAVGLILMKRSLLVFTNKRLLHIPTSWKFDFRGSLAQILYQDCRQLHIKRGNLVAEYHNGRTEKFTYIPACDRDVIKHFQFAASASDQRSANPQRNHLCPNCTEILPARAAACPACGLEFRTRAKALARSVLLPGGGYFYVNHPFIGIGDALGESYLVILALAMFFVGRHGDAEATAVFPIVLGALVLEKLLTIYHSNSFLDEFIPTDLKALLSGRPVRRPQPEEPPVPVPPGRQGPLEDILSVR